MTSIDEARKLQKALEKDIAVSLARFTEQTGIVIRDLYVRSVDRFPDLTSIDEDPTASIKMRANYHVDSKAEL